MSMTLHTAKTTSVLTIAYRGKKEEEEYTSVTFRKLPQSHCRMVGLLAWIQRTPKVVAPTALINLL